MERAGEEGASPLLPRKLGRRHDVERTVIGEFEVLRFGKGSRRRDRITSGKTSKRVRNERRWVAVRNARRRLLGIPNYDPGVYI